MLTTAIGCHTPPIVGPALSTTTPWSDSETLLVVAQRGGRIHCSNSCDRHLATHLYMPVDKTQFYARQTIDLKLQLCLNVKGHASIQNAAQNARFKMLRKDKGHDQVRASM